MKQRILSLSVLFCLLLSLAACGGGDGQANAPMTVEEYQSKVEEMSTDVSMAMASLSGLSFTDEASAREGIEAIRDMVTPFRDFAAISDPPESYAEAHAKIAEGCTLFADSLEDANLLLRYSSPFHMDIISRLESTTPPRVRRHSPAITQRSR